MSFKYDLTANQQTPTSGSKGVLCKSFKIDIAAGDGFTSGQTYDLGWLPKEAQCVNASTNIRTAVSGGTVSVATITIQSGGVNVQNGVNVFTTGVNTALSTAISDTSQATTDQKLTYTPTLTGAGATAGVLFINIFYVI